LRPGGSQPTWQLPVLILPVDVLGPTGNEVDEQEEDRRPEKKEDLIWRRAAHQN